MIDAKVTLPQPDEWITAEILYMDKLSIVHGKAMSDPKFVIYDFWSGSGASEIIRWKPRTPSFAEGHPYTAIERGKA